MATGLVVAVYLAFANVLSHQGYRTVAMAKPALASQSWESRVAAFADRLSAAFDLQPDRARRFAGWILDAADRQRLEPELIASLVQVESGFRENARSVAGAVGPAQVQPRYWSEFCGRDDLNDPAHNIHCGAQVLAHLKERCGAWNCALVAYNVGSNSTRRQAARRFVSKVDARMLDFGAL